MTLRRIVKRTALQSIRAVGGYAWTRDSGRRRNKLLVLCYHGLALDDENVWAGDLFITLERFRSRLQQLRDMNATVLPLGEALKRLRKRSLPQKAVAITFDDGFYDFLHLAVPALNEFQYPATLYLTTYYSGRRMPIVNLALNYLLWKSGEVEVAFPDLGMPEPMPIGHWMDRQRTVQRLLDWCEGEQLSTACKNEFARSVAGRFGIDYDEFLKSRMLQVMTPEEVVKAHSAGIDIQLHTHRHRTPLDRDLFVREIQENRDRISAITGKEPTHFCYPSGRYETKFFPWLRECGVQSATTCVRGFARPTSDPFLIPRVLDDSNMEPIEFEGVVSGLFA